MVDFKNFLNIFSFFFQFPKEELTKQQNMNFLDVNYRLLLNFETEARLISLEKGSYTHIEEGYKNDYFMAFSPIASEYGICSGGFLKNDGEYTWILTANHCVSEVGSLEALVTLMVELLIVFFICFVSFLIIEKKKHWLKSLCAIVIYFIAMKNSVFRSDQEIKLHDRFNYDMIGFCQPFYHGFLDDVSLLRCKIEKQSYPFKVMKYEQSSNFLENRMVTIAGYNKLDHNEIQKVIEIRNSPKTENDLYKFLNIFLKEKKLMFSGSYSPTRFQFGMLGNRFNMNGSSLPGFSGTFCYIHSMNSLNTSSIKSDSFHGIFIGWNWWEKVSKCVRLSNQTINDIEQIIMSSKIHENN